MEFSFEALEEAAAGFRRIEGFLERAREARIFPENGWIRSVGLPEAFTAAMDDDLGTPAAVAVLHETVREGNRQLAERDTEALLATYLQVTQMLNVLGLNPAMPAWEGTARADDRATAAVGALVAGLLEQRAAARAAKDWSRADEIRDQLKAAGIDLEDTPDGPKWSLA